MLTFVDVCDRLKQQDEISILEILEITSDELVDRFKDKIEDNFDYLAEDLEDEDYE
jgi:hypothetical protein